MAQYVKRTKPIIMITGERREVLLKTIRNGCTRKASAEAIHVSVNTFYMHMKHGNNAEQKVMNKEKLTTKEHYYYTFLIDVRAAEAYLEDECVQGILQAGKQNWTAYAWLLERRNPDAFGRRERIEHAGSVDIVLPPRADNES